jgi:DNA ligase (NAD+)
MKNALVCRWSGRWLALGFLLGLSLLVFAPVRAESTVRSESVSDAKRAADGDRIALERLLWLRREVARHDELYFKKAAPEISDEAYDALKRELRQLEETLGADAGDASLGDDRTGGLPGAAHRVRMLSLNKAYTLAELRSFHAKIGAQLGAENAVFTVEPKYDGLAISLTYERGQLVRAVTRGNGREGDDVTANLRTIASVPAQLRPRNAAGEALPIPEIVELRGEVYLTFAEFARINAEQLAAGKEPFAHPRNLAAGTLKLSDPALVAPRNLSAVFYGVGVFEPAEAQPSTQHELHALLEAWGLPGLEFQLVKSSAELARAVESAGEARGRLGFPTDGVVVKVDAVAVQRALGESDTAPNWAIAYKFSAERAETRVVSITIQVGRTGVLTPVAELAPVELAGSTIARASLHNRDAIARLDLRIGDYVYVEKAGEIIPAVVGVNFARRAADAPPFVFPRTCPACDTAVSAAAGEAAVRCPNYGCRAQVQRRIEHFVSKEGVDISGVGPVMIEKLVERGWVRDAADLYQLRREDLLTLGENAGKSTDRLLASIDRSKATGLARVIRALGIPEVGPATARELAAKVESLTALAGVSAEELRGRGVDRVAAEAVSGFFQRAENVALVRRLSEAGLGRRTVAESSAGPVASAVKPGALSGKVFVFTGTLAGLTREEAAEWVRAAGGIVRENVSRQTSYLVAGEGAGAKLTEAQRLAVPIIDEAELRRLVERTP